MLLLKFHIKRIVNINISTRAFKCFIVQISKAVNLTVLKRC
jgi:hypothetical protein